MLYTQLLDKALQGGSNDMVLLQRVSTTPQKQRPSLQRVVFLFLRVNLKGLGGWFVQLDDLYKICPYCNETMGLNKADNSGDVWQNLQK